MPTVNMQPGNVNHLKSQEKTVEYFDTWNAGVPGTLGMRVSPKGQKTWFILYRANGNKRRFTIGHYPSLSLSEARKKAAAELVEISKGDYDPMSVKIATKKAITFKTLAESYFDIYVVKEKKSKSSTKEDKRIYESTLKDRFGTKKAKDIKRKDLIDLHTEISKRGALVMANRTITLISTMFNHGIDIEMVKATPYARMKRIMNKETSRERILTDDEIKTLWKTMDSESDNMRDILRLILLTAQRPGEIAAIEVSEVDSNSMVWTIPSSKTKNKQTHQVPLSEQVWQIISPRMKNEQWIFPSKHGRAGKGKTHTKNTKDARRRLKKATGIEGWTSHDLRRTARTIMARNKVPPYIAERVLNHKQGGVEAIYDQHTYIEEKKKALNTLANHIDKILKIDKAPAKVVNIR